MIQPLNKVTLYRKVINKLEQQLERERREKAKIEKAFHQCQESLQFYSNDSNWKNEYDVYSGMTYAHIGNDCGKNAKNCLQNTQQN